MRASLFLFIAAALVACASVPASFDQVVHDQWVRDVRAGPFSQFR